MFVYTWEYFIKDHSQAEFERIYGPDGEWVQLFSKAEGYIKTELFHDLSKPLRYITIDYWKSEGSRNSFREQIDSEFKKLDKRCELLMVTS